MFGIQRLPGAVLWCCLVGMNWIQAQFIHPLAEWWLESVLRSWEESIKSLIREMFAQVLNFTNGVLNALFSWFPGYENVRTAFHRPSAWQAWWEEKPRSTFNAIIDRYDSLGRKLPKADGDSEQNAVSSTGDQLCSMEKHIY